MMIREPDRDDPVPDGAPPEPGTDAPGGSPSPETEHIEDEAEPFGDNFA